jgi:hypothetical protein
VSDTAILLTLLGLTIGAIVLGCLYWLWLDAKEAALQRKHAAEMADAAVRVVRAHKHDDRHTHEQIGRPE